VIVSAFRSKRRPAAPSAPIAPAGKQIVLHVGCGERNPERLHESFRGPEWHELRFDIDPEVEPDILGTIVAMDGVPSESVDAVWSSHNLEHVYAYQVSSVLGEFYRVLRPGGRVLVTMPDLQSVASFLANGKVEDACYDSPAGPITPLDILYGHGKSVEHGNEFMAHRTGFTARTLTQKLERAGFDDVKVDRRSDRALWGSGRRPS
jgi:SAM-dependent methyltransferase